MIIEKVQITPAGGKTYDVAYVSIKPSESMRRLADAANMAGEIVAKFSVTLEDLNIRALRRLLRPSRGMRKHIRRQKAAARRRGEVWAWVESIETGRSTTFWCIQFPRF